MWKDFFYFSKSQRAGIIVLIILIITVIILNYTLTLFIDNNEEPADKNFAAEVESFRKSLVSVDSIRQAEWQALAQERQKQYEEKYKQFSYETKPKQSYSLFAFDPNKIDSAGFVTLGLKPYIASNVLKYRNKGGKFRSASDFSKVYGISKEKFDELEPYIQINQKKDSVSIKPEPKKNIIVELNSADTTLLMQVKGIGRGYAKGIIRFRGLTGGFVSIEQLKEIYGMRPENYERIKGFCIVNQALVRKIKINSATVEKLNAHPYISYYQAKAIYELRRNKGKLKSKDDLNEISEISKEDLEKIYPYLSFE